MTVKAKLELEGTPRNDLLKYVNERIESLRDKLETCPPEEVANCRGRIAEMRYLKRQLVT